MIEDTYNDFLKEKIFQLFNKDEASQFINESEKHRPITIRANSLKIRRKDLEKLLLARGMEVKSLEWCSDGIIVFKSSVPIGATPEYLSGLYTIQGASSFLPILALDPQKNENILDMCSAPGGKTTHIAALLQNTGLLISCDADKMRQKATVGNCARLGITNCLVLCKDAREVKGMLFDRVLCDAPCSGTGVISKEPEVKINRSFADLRRTVKMQKKLILKGFDLLKAGGVLVYSTCSVLVEENECVVDFLLRSRKGKLMDVGMVGKDGFTKYRGDHFHPSMKKARRIYPHTHNMDGFFVAKIVKKC